MKLTTKIFIIFLFALGVFGLTFWGGVKTGQKYSEKKTNNSSEELTKVIRVVDGDTIQIESGEKIRLIGMDTPETVDPRKPVECFGKEASAKTKELVLGRMVRLEKDIGDTDKYGRLLRYVWVDGKMLNLTLVELGYAQVETVPPNVKYEKLFLKASQDARDANIGLWSACPDIIKTKKISSKNHRKKIF